MVGDSKELQDVAMAALIKYTEIFTKTIKEIDETYFSNLAYRLVYRCILKHYNNFLVLPSKKELALLIRENHTPDFGELSSMGKILDDLFNSDLSSEDFALDRVVEFIQRVRGERAFEKFLKVFDGKQVNIPSVVSNLADAMTVTISRAEAYELSDIKDLDKIKSEALGGSQNPVIIKFFLDELNNAMQYNGFIPGTLNCVAGPPGRGKSTLLINQGLSVAQQGYKVLHIFLGDMSVFDAYVRYYSCYSGIASKKLVGISTEDLGKLIQKSNMTGFFSNITVASYAADELTAGQLLEEIQSIQRKKKKHYDCIIVDYDENISYEDVDMYKSGGQIYNKLALFSRKNTSVIFIASQPKQEYWSHEILPMESLSESSKKQKIIDLLITLGKPGRNSSVATIHLAKNRRGIEGKIYRVSINGDNAQFKHISEDDYMSTKQQERNERDAAK